MSQRHGPTHHPTYDPAESVARARDLCRSLTPDAGVLTGVDLDLRGGEVVGLMGRRGSGKSTLLRALARVDQEVVGSGTLRLPETIVTIGDDPRLLGWKRVLDNVTMGIPAADVLARGRRALAEVGLADRELAWPDDLSAEERHRAALARALAHGVELLLAEEPYRHLDVLAQRSLHRQLRTVVASHGIAALFVTNDVHEALTLTDRVVVLRDGRIGHDLAVRRGQEAPVCEEYAVLHDHLLAELGIGARRGDVPGAPMQPRRETA